MNFHRIAATGLLAAGLALLPAVAQSQTKPQPQPQSQSQTQRSGENIQTRTSEAQTPTQTNYPKDQILTATVHQAWLLSGKNEANFFEIVEQLAQIAAANRGIQIPESEAAGRRMGAYIKASAKADTDQLLYAVVDKALLVATHASAHPAAHPAIQTAASGSR
jgi:hypothetical protein